MIILGQFVRLQVIFLILLCLSHRALFPDNTKKEKAAKLNGQ